jgi:hypothetical protein
MLLEIPIFAGVYGTMGIHEGRSPWLAGSVPVDEHGRTCIARQVERSRLRGLTELASHYRSKIICLIVDEIVISTRKKPIGRWCAPGL